jgi:DNA replication protein DnaC
VSKTCLVRFDNNKYSVNASAVGRPVEIHAYADRIVIRQDGRAVAEHARRYGRGETIYDPWQQQRNVVLVGGMGTGKTHLAMAIARSCIRAGSRGRFFNTVDLVNRLEAEARTGRQGRLADYLTRLDFVVLDELGYLPFAQAGGQLLFHLVSRLYERTSVIVTTGSVQRMGVYAALAGRSFWLACG